MPNKAKKAVAAGKASSARLWERVERGDFRALDERLLSEEEVSNVAERIKGEVAFGSVLHLIEALPKLGETYDWNVGGLLQHFEPELAVSAVQHAGDRAGLYDSVGLAWAFGQFRNRNRFIVEYLHAVVREAKNGDAWWQAAFSLENLGEDNAVNLLKRTLRSDDMPTLPVALKSLEDKRSVIAVLAQSTSETSALVYPHISKTLAKASSSKKLQVNALWLAGRLRIFDDAIVNRAIALTASSDYELQHYAYFALQNHPSDAIRELFERGLRSADRRSRRFAARGLRVIGSQSSIDSLEAALLAESDATVVFEITKSLYRLKNPINAERLRIRQSAYRHENGAMSVGDIDPALYDRFAEAHDPEGVCFALLRALLHGRKIMNPVDINARTGSLTRRMFDGLSYSGTLYGVDPDSDMVAYADRRMRRERHFRKPVELISATAAEFAAKKRGKSSLVVSSFRYQSLDVAGRIRELKAVHDLLSEDGVYVTIGWDELYNDAALSMWFKYVPDGIAARDFEEWRQRRMGAVSERSSDGLTWAKRGINAPLQFLTMEDSAQVVGHLFGRDSAQYAIRNRRTEWSMSLGITCDTKKSVRAAIAALETGSEE